MKILYSTLQQQQQGRPFSGPISKARSVLQTMFYRLNERLKQ